MNSSMSSASPKVRCRRLGSSKGKGGGEELLLRCERASSKNVLRSDICFGGAGKSESPDIRDEDEVVRKLLRVGLEAGCKPEFTRDSGGDCGISKRVFGGCRRWSWAYDIWPVKDSR